jgi:biotin transport system substrate-specific component
MTLADAIRPELRAVPSRRARTVALVVAGSAVVALTAQVSIPLPWTPVPITGQLLGVMLVGAALGARRGVAALALYLAEGAAGLPFFAGGAAGFAHLLGPSGGYLWGFPLAAAATGWLAERGWDRRFVSAALAMTLGNIVVYATGLPWLARFVGWEQVWTAGFWPFVPGALIKIGVAAALLPFAWILLGGDRGKGLHGQKS